MSKKKTHPVTTLQHPTGVQQGSDPDLHADDKLPSSPRLTAAALATAERELRVSAEQLPVSHRLPVSRSVFDSDEGKLSCFLAC